MKSWVWILAIADTQDSTGNCVTVYKDRTLAQTAFRDALKRYGGNRRYDMCLKQITSVESFLQANPQYRPVDAFPETLPA